jgi:AraC-like DNA-binding protein
MVCTADGAPVSSIETTSPLQPDIAATRWRMLLAADRMKESADGLSTIAHSLGYESESSFGKAFRRVMGCSPRQYTRSSALYAVHEKHGAGRNPRLNL